MSLQQLPGNDQTLSDQWLLAVQIGRQIGKDGEKVVSWGLEGGELVLGLVEGAERLVSEGKEMGGKWGEFGEDSF